MFDDLLEEKTHNHLKLSPHANQIWPALIMAGASIAGSLINRKKNQPGGRGSQGFSDPWTQYNLPDSMRRPMGEAAYSGTMQGLGGLSDWSSGNIGGLLGNLRGAMGGIMGGMGGGGGGGVGRMGGRGGGGYNPATQWLWSGDPFDDKFVKSLLGQGTEDEREQFDVQRGNLGDYMTRMGIAGPAAAGAFERMGRGQARTSAGRIEGRRLWGGEQALQNRRMAGEQMTGRDISRDRLAGTLGAARIGAGSQNYATNMGFLGNMMGLSHSASSQLGGGGPWQNIGRPYSMGGQQQQGGGWGSAIGAGLGAAGSIANYYANRPSSGGGGLSGMPGEPHRGFQVYSDYTPGYGPYAGSNPYSTPYSPTDPSMHWWKGGWK